MDFEVLDEVTTFFSDCDFYGALCLRGLTGCSFTSSSLAGTSGGIATRTARELHQMYGAV